MQQFVDAFGQDKITGEQFNAFYKETKNKSFIDNSFVDEDEWTSQFRLVSSVLYEIQTSHKQVERKRFLSAKHRVLRLNKLQEREKCDLLLKWANENRISRVHQATTEELTGNYIINPFRMMDKSLNKILSTTVMLLPHQLMISYFPRKTRIEWEGLSMVIAETQVDVQLYIILQKKWFPPATEIY